MPGETTPLLLFFTKSTSGPARRMESLLAHLARKERGRLRISKIDVDDSPDWGDRFSIDEVPTLVLIKERRVSAPQIEKMLAPHLGEAAAPAAA